MLHVGLHHGKRKLDDHFFELVDAFFASSNLRLEIGNVLHHVANRIFARGEQLGHFLFQESALLHQQHVVDEHAFLVDVPAVGRHGAGSDAAHVGVVTAGGDVEKDLVAFLVKHGSDHRNVRQMGAAVVGIIQDIHVATAHLLVALADDLLNALAHGA